MKKQVLIIAIGLAVLSGCVNNTIKEYQHKEAELESLAESGQITWAQYYSSIGDEVLAMPYFRGNNSVLNYSIAMEGYARQFEAGEIPEEDFHRVRRYMQKYLESTLEQVKAENSQRFSRALQEAGSAMQPDTTHCTSTDIGDILETTCR